MPVPTRLKLQLGLLLLLSSFRAAHAQQDPTAEDWQFVQELVHDKIDRSTCPDDPENGHWDWNGQSGDESDCLLFPRLRNPFPLGSRLLRLAFHDAMGISEHGDHQLDAVLDLFDNKTTHGRLHAVTGRGLNPEHNGLDSAIVVLDDMYDNELLEDGSSMNSRLSKADFYVWAYLAAVTHAAERTQDDLASDNGWNIPKMKVRFGYVTGDASNPPTEVPPPFGPNTNNADILAYFQVADEFNFTESESVALMGAHTLGGARRDTSGHTGMWTQSKPKFNTAYYSNLKDPVPLACEETGGTAGGADTCEYFRAEGTCASGDGPRCKGWQQVQITSTCPYTGTSHYKFQWRHSCDNAQEDCAHVMLNVDMALLKDIDEHLCIADDVDTAHCNNETVGKVKSFPNPLPSGLGSDASFCDIDNLSNDRIYAFCFHDKDNTKQYIDEMDEDTEAKLDTFMLRFAAVFDKLLTVDGLTDLTTTGSDCTSPGAFEDSHVLSAQDGLGSAGCDHSDTIDDFTHNPFPCCACESGVAGRTIHNTAQYWCRPKGWSTNQAGALCSSDCENQEQVAVGGAESDCDETDRRRFECAACLSGWAGENCGGTYTCKPVNWSPSSCNRRSDLDNLAAATSKMQQEPSASSPPPNALTLVLLAAAASAVVALVATWVRDRRLRTAPEEKPPCEELVADEASHVNDV